MIGLTQRHADCLRVIEELTVDGMSPTYAQIGAALGLSGKSGIHRLISALEERGLLRRIPYRSRALQVVCSAAPTKTKIQIADEVCQRVWERTRAGEKVGPEHLHTFVMEALS